MDIRPPPPSKPAAGFTLIELMIALAVLAILAGSATPSLRQLLVQHQMTSAVNGFVVGFQRARMHAVSHGEQTAACPSHDGRSCTGGLDWTQGWLIYADHNRNRQLDADESVLNVFQPLHADLSAASSIGRPQLIYRSDGSSAGSNLRITVCDQRNLVPGRSIVVNQSGRPRTAPDELGRC